MDREQFKFDKKITYLTIYHKIPKGEAYEIARKLNVDLNQIPCLILFGKEINSERLIVPIPSLPPLPLEQIPKYFRELFSKIENLLSDVSKVSNSESFFKTLSCHFKAILNYLDKYAEKTECRVQYLYEGHVIIAQNTYNKNAPMYINGPVSNSDLKGGSINSGNSS